MDAYPSEHPPVKYSGTLSIHSRLQSAYPYSAIATVSLMVRHRLNIRFR